MNGQDQFKDLKEYFKTGRRLQFQKNELILRAGEVPRGVYLIDSGIIKIYALSRHGNEHIHHFFGAGDFFPMTWIFRDFTRNLFYECVEPVTVWLVPKQDFQDFVLKNDRILLKMLEEVVQRYLRYSGRIENLLYSDARERSAYRLLSLANRFGKKTAAGIVIKASITHEDMAHSLNMTRETFSRALARFQQSGIVAYDKNRCLVIKDLPALINIIGYDESIYMWPNLMKFTIDK